MPNIGPMEIAIVLIIALVIVGPKKLPELGKSLGQTLGQFKRASEDFKRSWEEEVEVEKRRVVDAVNEPAVASSQVAPKIVPAPNTIAAGRSADVVDAEPAAATGDEPAGGTVTSERTA